MLKSGFPQQVVKNVRFRPLAFFSSVSSVLVGNALLYRVVDLMRSQALE